MSEAAENSPTVEFPRLVGQPRIREVLARTLSSGRVPHAWLLLGPPGSGKDAAALDIAQALLCHSDHERHGSTPERIPCGECDSCVQMGRLGHPNLKLLFPLPTPKTSADDDVEAGSSDFTAAQQKAIDDTVASKASDAYAPLEVTGGKEILIAHMRQLRHEFSLTSYSGGWRVVVLSQADRLRVQAANAFLKLLEEPPDKVMFILTSSRESRLLSTIVSRCQTLRFGPLPDSLVRQELMSRYDADERTADAAARLARGSWREAVRWTREDPAAEMEQAVELLRALAKTEPGLLDERVDRWSSGSGPSELPRLLELLSTWLRDVLRLVADPEAAGQQIRDESLIKFARYVADRDVEDALEQIEQARLDLEANVQPSLVVHHLFVRMAQILFTKRAARR